VSNHSYTFAAGWEEVPVDGSFGWSYRTLGAGFGEYGVTAWFWDDVMYQSPYYLAVKAAGNEAGQGPDSTNSANHYHNRRKGYYSDFHPLDCGSGFGCIDPLATSKNALIVGALDYDGIALADFSSRGPTLDGRIKPDVVSAGTAVYSTKGPDRYGVSSGTSMASPTVAGSIALLYDLERRLFGPEPKFTAATIKALLIHGADDLGNPGPDYLYGWGRVNIQHTVDLMIAGTGSAVAISQLEITDESVFEFNASGGEFKATIAWMDRSGAHPNTIADKSKPVLVDDLDLTVEQGGLTHYPFVLDVSVPDAPAVTGINNVDNVEQVLIPAPSAGRVRVRIKRKSASTMPMRVSLVVSGIAQRRTTARQSEIIPNIETPTTIFPNPARSGETVRIVWDDHQPHIVCGLVDVTGRVVASLGQLRGELSANHFAVPPHLSPGLYFIRISSEQALHVLPISIIG
jgi:hypothetical protein